MPLAAAESPFLAAIVSNLAVDGAKLIYADWLEDRGDERCEFLRRFVAASQTMDAAEFPEPGEDVSSEWLELIGFRLLRDVAAGERPHEIKELVLRLARPA